MGRGHIAKATVVELEKRIDLSEKKIRELIRYLERLKESYHKQEISYSRYIEITHKKIDGRTIKEWLDYYDNYIQECETLIKQQKKSLAKKQSTNFYFCFRFCISPYNRRILH